MAPKPVDAQALAEDVRKLIKRVDELETEKKNLVRKSADQETAIKALRNRSNDLNHKAEMAEKKATDLEGRIKATYVRSYAPIVAQCGLVPVGAYEYTECGGPHRHAVDWGFHRRVKD